MADFDGMKSLLLSTNQRQPEPESGAERPLDQNEHMLTSIIDRPLRGR